MIETLCSHQHSSVKRPLKLATQLVKSVFPSYHYFLRDGEMEKTFEATLFLLSVWFISVTCYNVAWNISDLLLHVPARFQSRIQIYNCSSEERHNASPLMADSPKCLQNSGILKAVYTMDPAGCYKKDYHLLNFYCLLPLVIILKMRDTKVKQLKIYHTTQILLKKISYFHQINCLLKQKDEYSVSYSTKEVLFYIYHELKLTDPEGHNIVFSWSISWHT